jgi:hypothetical protein
MDFLKTPICMSICGACLTVALSFIENKINKKNRKALDHLKVFFITFLGIYTCNFIYLNYLTVDGNFAKKIFTGTTEENSNISKIVPRVKNVDNIANHAVKNIKKNIKSSINIPDNNANDVIRDVIGGTDNDVVGNVVNDIVGGVVNNVGGVVDVIDTGLPDF